MKTEAVAIPHHEHARAAISRWEQLKSDRSRHETLWNEIARLIRPQRGDFGRDNYANRDLDKPLSSAPLVASSNFAAGLYGTLTKPGNRWMVLTVDEEALSQHKPTALGLGAATSRDLGKFQAVLSPV